MQAGTYVCRLRDVVWCKERRRWKETEQTEVVTGQPCHRVADRGKLPLMIQLSNQKACKHKTRQ